MKKIWFLFLIMTITVLYAQTPDVVINEFGVKANPEWIEIYNTTGSSIDLTGWYLVSPPDDTINLSGNIAAGGYASFEPSTNILSNGGDSIWLFDNTDALIDYVSYGFQGSPPVGVYNSNNPAWSTARITDGLYTMANCGMDFNVDGTPTRDAANDAHSAPLDAVVAINEIDPYPPVSGDPDSVELFNPGSSPVDITGWQISDGDDWGVIGSHQIPAQGFIVIDENEIGLDFSAEDVCYLFTPDTQRVDQMGWAGEYNDYTFQRIPDGSAPHDGFDWLSSGGGSVLFDTTETWGYSNGGTFVAEDPGFQVNVNDYQLQCLPVNQGRNVRISFSSPQLVRLKVYSVTGRLINDLYQGDASRGVSVLWNGTDLNGDNISRGSYMVVLETGDQLIAQKVNIFVK